MKKAMLVYQAGIANVFEVNSFNLSDFGRHARRLIQGTFEQCQCFAAGLGVAGVMVTTAACNMAGDVVNAHWTEDLDNQPFSEHLIRVTLNTIGNAA